MFYRKLIQDQIQSSGLRLGDSCSVYPSHGHKRAFTLNRYCLDFVSRKYRPKDLSLSYVELPQNEPKPFHYRLEIEGKVKDEGRFILKTLKGNAFWLNGLAAREAYVERADRVYLEDHRVSFDSGDLKELTLNHFEHPILQMSSLVQSDLKILILGETGTGKTHLAKAIHSKSGRRGNFVPINLSSYNPMLIESELFGHKRGSFTGAFHDKKGAIEMAQEGTLFLDEIDSLPLELQTKLLTFIDTKTYRRVGDVKEKEAKTRLIFASGRSLETMVEQGYFRRDLYFRLKAGHTLELQSLRNDIKKISDACQYFALTNGVSFSKKLIEFYESLAWPGNLRELFSHLEKKKILSKSTKLDFDIYDEALLLQSSDLMSLKPEEELITMKECKLIHVKKAITLCQGNIAMAAKKLLVNEKTVRSILMQD